MSNIKNNEYAQAFPALQRAITLHLSDPNVTHIDLGKRIRTSHGNRLEDEFAVRVHLRRKLSDEAFKRFAEVYPDRVIDADTIGFPVDIPEARYDLHRQGPVSVLSRSARHERLAGGISISNFDSFGYGTLGAIVRDNLDGAPMVLSNWHVLAQTWLAEKGLSICQPAIADWGSYYDIIANLERDAMGAGIDAAVAKLNPFRKTGNEQLGLGEITSIVKPEIGMRVVKSGRGSGITHGVVSGIHGESIQEFAGLRKHMRHIIHITQDEPRTEVSRAGDSGAIWLEQHTNKAVALHFAGSDMPEFALAFSISEVLQALNVSIG